MSDIIRAMLGFVIQYFFEIIGCVFVILVAFAFGQMFGEGRYKKREWLDLRNKILNDEVKIISVELVEMEKEIAKNGYSCGYDYIKIYYSCKVTGIVSYYRINLDYKKIAYVLEQKELLQLDREKENVVYLPYDNKRKCT
ncbi:hypothetical protein [Breznakia pachnodae]|uniref:Uncharacterized protein n=1 Tax=Breznakia pachnodae TaxID=265178 RepID=A0ABU0DZN2_9FIRM|nr:hypothetical protein [Breznakia pachnodae]MDQ0360000.1 hypothetical protein [Breznakia pachnodae]